MIRSFARTRSSLKGFLKPYTTSNFGHGIVLPKRIALSIHRATSSSPRRTFSVGSIRHDATSDVRVSEPEIATSEAPPVTKFAELGERKLVDEQLVRALLEMGLESLTPVQTQTIQECLNGGDVVAQAKTGTGKTLAFLVPLFQRILGQNPNLAQPISRAKTDIQTIIISPTRELAQQIADEARKVAQRTGIKVQTAVGGLNKLQGLQTIHQEGCHVLVATPGRLHDILRFHQIEAPNLKALVLDEADRLLDVGFGPQIESIAQFFPDKRDVDRQTLMFSATMPPAVENMVKIYAKPGHKFIQTVQRGEQPTHERVDQKLVPIPGLENTMPAVLELAKRELDRTDRELPFKAIVFFNANAEAMLAAATFREIIRDKSNGIKSVTVSEMHSRLSQNSRTHNSLMFRKASSAILFSSDVTARGMDFPNVTHVIQAGLPVDEETYVHRIGRTARAGKSGEGWMFLTPPEIPEARRRLQGMRLEEDRSLESAAVDMTREAQIPANIANILTAVVEATKNLDYELKEKSYKATLGCFQWYPRKLELIDLMNRRSRFGWALSEPPPLPKNLAQRLGLAGIHGVRIEDGRGSSKSTHGSFNRSLARRGDGGRSNSYPKRSNRRSNGYTERLR